MQKFTGQFPADSEAMRTALGCDSSFDLLERPLRIAERSAALYFVDGFAKDEIMEKVLEFFYKLTPEDLAGADSVEAFSKQFVPYIEHSSARDVQETVTAVLSGQLALLLDGYDQAIVIDVRQYPTRSPEEPEGDKVLRGARDGFVETIVFNTAMLRRRLRTPELTMEIHQVGSRSKTDVVLCFMKGQADEKLLDKIRRRLDDCDFKAMTMGQENVAECVLDRQWFNPFPRMRYTERPDAAAAAVAEGRIVLLVDNSPAAMIAPCVLFDFTQESNDFYFPPMVGTYLKLVRTIVFLATLLLTPVWFLLMKNPAWIPPWLDFIKVSEPNSVPLFAQLMIIELVLDAIKLASLNTPTALSNSFSIVGALILGDFAVKAGWFVPEVVLYMAFVAIANYSQPSFELGYAVKLFRMLLLILVELFGLWGFIGGVALMFLVALFTRTVRPFGYLRPLIPFKPRAFFSMFVRRPSSKNNT